MNQEGGSQAFSAFHHSVQKWIWEQGWGELREAQERAALPIMEQNTHLIISASTASGKTEAAFLPIISAIMNDNKPSSVLYVSPLKALINDQFLRLGPLCQDLNLAVCAWHGDSNRTQKQRFLKENQGIMLITPESLEAILVNHGFGISKIFRYLKYIVIDELHSFIESPRGKQLQSLLHRIEKVLGKDIPRIGLSATLGDMHLAQEF